MKATDSWIAEDHEASLLAAYDEALAAGQAPALDEQALSSLGPAALELRADLDCLMLLARRRPRRRVGQENGTPKSPAGSASMTQLGRFRILCELGRGGQGLVFLAFDPALGRQVALKVPRPEALLTPDLRQRFLREAQAAAGLDHPNLVPVHEAGEVGPVCYIASAYCPGRSLAALLKEQSEPMAARSAAQLIATSAKAVHYIHSRGVLHRDLKPANILIDADGTPRITDFGLAKQLHAPADGGQTHTGAVLGTPAYMAPEQAAGRSRDISTATDIYALGAILYECLTGRSPFGGDGERPLLERVVAEEPAPPRRLLPGLARDLETICLTCLHKDPRRRYSSALALAEDLDNWLEHRPIAARPTSARERLIKWIRRRPAVAALTCVSAVAVLVVLAGSLWHSQVLGHALDESDQLRREGLARETRLGDLLYVADMRLAKEAWDNGDLVQLEELLGRHVPAEGGTDRRGFEWHWLRRCLGARVGTLKAHDGGLLCAAVSPNDQFLVTGDSKGNVKIWYLASLQPIVSLRGHTKEVHRAVFSRDGRTLATCSQDRTVRLWDVATWRQVGCLQGHDMTVRSVAFSPDGTRLVSAGRDHRLVLWELPRGRALRSWTAHDDVIHDVAFTPNGRTFGSVGKDNCVRLWDLASGTQRARLPAGHELNTLAFSPDSQTLAVSGWGDTIRLWDMGDLASPPVDLTSPHSTEALAFASSGTRLAAAGSAGLVNVWDLGPARREARLRKPLHRREGKGRAVAFARGDNLLLAAFEEDGTVELWDQERLAGWESVSGLPADLGFVALSTDGWRAAFTVNTGKTCLVDLVNRRVEHSFDVPPFSERVAFSSSGESVAVAGNEKGAMVWDVASGRAILTLKGQGDVVAAVAFSPRGDLVATGNKGPSARLWEWPSGELRATCGGRAGGCRNLAFTPDGRTLAVSNGDDHTISLWDTSSGHRRGLIPGQGVMVTAVAFAPDGQGLAVGGFDGIIRLWDVNSVELRATLSGHRGPVSSLAFSSDGRTLASQGNDDVLKLWHPGTAQELATLATQFHLANGVAFSGDGQTLLAAATPADKKSPSSLLLWRAGPTRP